MTEDQIYARIGEDGFERLVRAFFLQIPEDDVLSAIYPKDEMMERVREFLADE